MLMLFICINLLSVLGFSLLANYSHIFLCFCCYAVVLSCLLNIIMYLTWNHFALILNIYYKHYS